MEELVDASTLFKTSKITVSPNQTIEFPIQRGLLLVCNNSFTNTVNLIYVSFNGIEVLSDTNNFNVGIIFDETAQMNTSYVRMYFKDGKLMLGGSTSLPRTITYSGIYL